MAIAMTLKDYLEDSGVSYDVISHNYTTSSMSTAEATHISGEQLIKSIILEDEDGYIMAVVPSTHHVELGCMCGVVL